jgi:hypothetical protein
MLEKNKDFKVIYTRKIDEYPSFLTEPTWPTEVRQIFSYPFTVILLQDLQLTVRKLTYRDPTRTTKTWK